MATSVDEPNEDLVAKARRDRAARKNIFSRMWLFIQQVFAELKKVTTPSRSELVKFTTVVLAFVVVMMGILWVLDCAFGLLMIWLFGGGLTG